MTIHSTKNTNGADQLRLAQLVPQFAWLNEIRLLLDQIGELGPDVLAEAMDAVDARLLEEGPAFAVRLIDE